MDESTTRISPGPDAPPQRIGPYRILNVLGEGGMGVVYLAEQEQPIKRRVALKVVKLGMGSQEILARFESERQALALMTHPHIAKVFDAGWTEDGRPYFVMEYVPGVSITTYCDQHRVPVRERLELFRVVCHAVQHAHQKGVIHRDIKPSNILVSVDDGRPTPHVIDFGVAKAINQRLAEATVFTQHGHLVGTPAYMSPEQAEMSELGIDTTSDVYSLGILLYELLVGVLPFDPESLRKAGYAEMQRVIREEEPPRPSTRLSGLGAAAGEMATKRLTDASTLLRALKRDLDWIILKAIEKDRTRRYPSASELAMDVGRYLDNDAVIAGPASLAYKTRKFIRKHRVVVAAAAAVIVALLAGLSVSSVMYLDSQAARRRAEMQAYLASLSAADAHIVTAEAQRRADIADLAQSQLVAASPQLRNWEWRYLATRLDGSVATLWGTIDPSSSYGNVRPVNVPVPRSRVEYRDAVFYKGTIGYAPQSGQIVWATAGGVHAWDLKAKRLTGAWAAFGIVFALSADGSALLSADWRLSRPWRVIATRTGATIAVLALEEDGVQLAEFSPDGETLATIDGEGNLRLWSATTGQALGQTRIPGLTAFVHFGPHSDRLIAGVREDLYDWSFRSDAAPRKLTGNAGVPLVAAILSARGNVIVADSTGAVRQVQTTSGVQRPIGQHPGVRSIALAPSGAMVATGGGSGEIRLWGPVPALTGQEPYRLDPHGSDPIDQLFFSPDERFLVAGSSRGVLRIWDLTAVRLSMGRPLLSSLLAVSANGRQALTAGLVVPPTPPKDLSLASPATMRFPQRVSRVDLETLDASPIGLQQPDVRLAAISNDGTRAVFAGSDGVVRVWSSDAVRPSDVKAPGTVTTVAVDPAGERFAAVWRQTTASVENAAGGDSLRVWDRSGREILSLDDQLTADVQFDDTGGRLLTTPRREMRDGVERCTRPIQLWDLTRPRMSTSIGECARLAAIVGGTIATHSQSDGRIRVWNARNGSLQATSTESVPANALALTSDGSRIVAATVEGLRVFDPATGTLLLTVAVSKTPTSVGVRTPNTILRFTVDGSRLILASALGLNILEARTDYSPDARATARSLIGPGLTRFQSSAGVQLADEVIDEINANQALDPEVRRLAIEEVRQIGNWDLAALCHSSRSIAARPGLTRNEYARALRMAEAVNRGAPWSSYCVGVSALAMYRTGDYDGTLKRLEAVLLLRPELLPAEIAVKAMALVALGRRTEAESAVTMLDTKPDAIQSADEESLALIKELRSLVTRRGQYPLGAPAQRATN
jgi:serine/threonine protein kinase/WD40 repeat protein